MEKTKAMVDISDKPVTVRNAKAAGKVVLGKEAFGVLVRKECKKGDVLETAKIAAINTVKMTPAIVPMCHAISIEGVGINFSVDKKSGSVGVEVQVTASAKTGVEMEALCGVSAACLSIYDMLKYVSHNIVISEIKLLQKSGGKSGTYKRKD